MGQQPLTPEREAEIQTKLEILADNLCVDKHYAEEQLIRAAWRELMAEIDRLRIWMRSVEATLGTVDHVAAIDDESKLPEFLSSKIVSLIDRLRSQPCACCEAIRNCGQPDKWEEEDSRLRYLTVQIDKEDWAECQKVLGETSHRPVSFHESAAAPLSEENRQPCQPPGCPEGFTVSKIRENYWQYQGSIPIWIYRAELAPISGEPQLSDTERLDWLNDNWTPDMSFGFCDGESLREAIDAAMKRGR